MRVGADVNGYQKSLNSAKGSLNNFANGQKKAVGSMNSSMSSMAGMARGAALAVAAAAAAAVAALGAIAVGGVKSAMTYESSMQQINRIMGASAASFTNWADTQAIAFNMSRVEAMKYGAVYGNLMSNISSDQATVTQYTTDLLKASAVVASATGRDMTDVMERIRSGREYEYAA